MGLFDNWRKIIGSPSGYSEQRKKNVQDAINKQYSTPSPQYTPSYKYPTHNTTTRPGDTLYRTREDWERANSRNINTVYDIDRIIENPEVRKAFPQKPGEWDRAYKRRLKQEVEARKQNLDLLNQKVTYNPNPTQNFFAHRQLNPDQKVFTTLDIETDDYSRPISISASRLQWDPKQKKFVSIDSYQRFYLSSNKDLIGTFDVHGMTSSKLLQLRDQQKAKYSIQYNYDEMEDLKQYLGNSTIIGHNIVGFDLNRLFPDAPIHNSTIDTLLAARSTWKGDKNALDDVFYRLYGKTMEQAGLPHHDPNADTIASAMILQKMAIDKGYTGQALRYVMKSMDPAHIAEYDSTMHSMITRGTYWDMFRNHDLFEVYMEEKEAGLTDVYGNPIGSPEDFAGRIHKGPTSIDDKVGMQQLQEELHVVADVVHKLAGRGVGGSDKMSSDLFQAFNQFNNYKRLGLVQKIAATNSTEELDTIMEAAGYQTKGDLYDTIKGMGMRLKAVKESESKNEFELTKKRKIAKLERHNKIDGDDIAILRATKSFEDLEDAIDKVVTANEKYKDVLLTIADIKPYDMNQYISSKKGQWSGIMNASRGVVPDFLREPIGRLADAGFNSIDRSMAPWNAASRTWNSGIGRVVMGAATAVNPLLGAGIGIAAGASQMYGNYKQAQMEMMALNVQNNLNTLGAMISWISTPFQLLHKATKLLIGSFSGLTLKLNNIMATGINDMSQMGNPLEQLTGVDYIKYQGTTLMDMASLTNKGSTNAAIESMAKMQRDLYRFGKVDTNKLLAANMLGVFSEAFTPSTDAVGSYYDMANKILNNMQGQNESQRADTLYYATQLNETLAQTLRSALMLGVTDVRQMTNPSMTGNYMYWRPISDAEESKFRKTQFEFGTAGQQFGFSKMRFADRLWDAIGRDVYNGFNRLLDSAASGDWKGVLDAASAMWEKFKTTVKGVWDGLMEGGLGDKFSEGLSNAWDAIKEWAVKIGIGIVDVWNQIFRIVLDKAQGLVAYLSTISLKPHFDWKNGLSFEFSSIKDAEDLDVDKLIYNPMTGKVNKGMEAINALAAKYIPGYEDRRTSELVQEEVTPRDVMYAMAAASMGPGEGVSLPGYVENYKIVHSEDAYNLLNALWKGESEGTGFRKQAAFVTSKVPKRVWAQDMYDSMGLLSSFDTFKEATNEALVTAASIATGGKAGASKDSKVLFKFDFSGKEVTATYQQGKGVTVSGMPLMQRVTVGNGVSVSATQAD